MTDENFLDQGQVEQAPQQAPEVNSFEARLPKADVDVAMGKIKKEFFEKGRAAAMQSAQQVSQGSLTKEQVEAMIAEQTQAIQAEQARMAMAERVVGEFAGKMNLGKEAYEDFEQTVGQVDLSTIPEIVQLANSVGNTHDVMYDLAKNPYKIGNLLTLARANPHLARIEINRLSQSITNNKSAQQQVSGMKEPLSQIKPSSTQKSADPSSVSDYKKLDWLRG